MMADKVNKGDHIVIERLELDALVWMVDEEPDRHDRIWAIRYEHKLGTGYTVGKRVHISKVFVVDVTETIYDPPHTRWNPEKAKAEAEKLLPQVPAES